MISTMELATSLHGLKFPCDTADLVEYASTHGARAEVVGLLQRLPERRFNSQAELWQAAGEVS